MMRWIFVSYCAIAGSFFFGLGCYLTPESQGAALVLTWPPAAALWFAALVVVREP